MTSQSTFPVALCRKTLRMEYFYRQLRRETGYLMDGEDPAGGQWNFDADNRKRMPKSAAPPDLPRFEPDAITQSVLALAAERFSDHFGEVFRIDPADPQEL